MSSAEYPTLAGLLAAIASDSDPMVSPRGVNIYHNSQAALAQLGVVIEAAETADDLAAHIIQQGDGKDHCAQGIREALAVILAACRSTGDAT